MSRSQFSLPVSQQPTGGAAPDAKGDDIAYESGGLGFRLMGVAAICTVLWLGTFLFGMKRASTVMVAFGAVGAAWVYWREAIVGPRRRAEEMRDAAARLGLAGQADFPPQEWEKLKLLPPFNAGHKHKGSNVYGGTYEGAPVYLFDFYYQIPGAKAAANYWQTVAFFPKAARLPDFYLSPRGFLDNVAHMLGFQDIAYFPRLPI